MPVTPVLGQLLAKRDALYQSYLQVCGAITLVAELEQVAVPPLNGHPLAATPAPPTPRRVAPTDAEFFVPAEPRPRRKPWSKARRDAAAEVMRKRWATAEFRKKATTAIRKAVLRLPTRTTPVRRAGRKAKAKA